MNQMKHVDLYALGRWKHLIDPQTSPPFTGKTVFMRSNLKPWYKEACDDCDELKSLPVETERQKVRNKVIVKHHYVTYCQLIEEVPESPKQEPCKVTGIFYPVGEQENGS